MGENMAYTKNVSLKKQLDISGILFKILLLAPAFVLLVLFLYYPIIETFRLSFMKADTLGNETFIGLRNFERLLTNDDFIAGLIHVFQWAFWSVVLQIPAAFIISFICITYKTKVINGLRGVFYLSNVIPPVIVTMLGIFLLGPNYGAIKTFAHAVGWTWISNIDFLGNPKIAFWSLFALASWTYMGFGIVYLMANIDQIPAELFEAALIDGANKWQYARHIVIPQIKYALSVQALLATIGSLKLFDLPWLLLLGGPGNATTTLGIELYKEGFINSQYGKGAAIGVVIFLLSLIFSIIQFYFQKDQKN